MAGIGTVTGREMPEGRRNGMAGRLILSSILAFGQTAAAMVWLGASGPVGWIFAFCATVELLFFLRALLGRPGLERRPVARTLIDRLTKVGLWAVFLFGAGAIIIGLDITPASAYLAWFQLVQEGAGGGTLAYMFAVKFAYFGALFGGFVLVGSAVSALLNLSAVDLLIAAVLLGKPGLAAIGLVLFLIAVGRRVMLRNPRFKKRAVISAVQVSLVAFIVALPFSLFHFRNHLIDDLFNVRMEGLVARIFPSFPFLYNVPGYGYTLESSKIGDRPALTSRPVFEVTAPPGSTIYIRTGVYDTYTGEGWDLSHSARRTAEREVSRFESTSNDSSFVPTERLTFKILIDFYSSLPHALGTVAFSFPDGIVPQSGFAGLGAGFVLDAPLRRGSEVVDLIARPGDSTPRPVVLGYGGRVFPSDAVFPPWDGGSFVGRNREGRADGGPDPVEYDRGGSRSVPGVGNEVVVPELLSTITDSTDYSASRERTAATENRGPVPPEQSAANTAEQSPGGGDAASGGGRAGGAYPVNDGDGDDMIWDPPFVHGNGEPPLFRSNGRGHYPGYRRPTAESLPRAQVPPPKYGLQYERYVLTPRERAADLQIGSVPARLRELADRLGAGRDQAATLRAIRNYLVDNYKYSLSTSTSGPYQDAVSNFLFASKTGFCVQFASAFVILARLNNIPARYVTGFLANLPTGSDRMTVTGLSAHSWAETWNNQLGWVTQEATPPMIAAVSGDPNVLQQYNPSDSSFTQRQLVALLGGRLNRSAPAPTSSPTNLSTDLSRMASPLAGLPTKVGASVVLLALLLLLVRFSYFRLAPVEVRFRRIVRQIARRSKARGLPDPSRRGWREWSRGVVAQNPARSPVAHRAAFLIHRSFFAGNRNGYHLLRRDVVFLRILYRRMLRRRRPGAPTPRAREPVP